MFGLCPGGGRIRLWPRCRALLRCVIVSILSLPWLTGSQPTPPPPPPSYPEVHLALTELAYQASSKLHEAQ